MIKKLLFLCLLLYAIPCKTNAQFPSRVYDEEPDEKEKYTLLINKEGNWGGLTPFYSNGLWGFRGVINPEYDAIKRPEYNYAPLAKFIITRKNGKWGLISTMGIVLLNHAYDDMEFFSYSGMPGHFPDHVRAKYEGRWGIISVKGELKVLHLYDSILASTMDAGLVICKLQDKYGLVNALNGSVVLPFEYEFIGGSAYRLKVIRNGKAGVINAQQKVIIPLLFEDVDMHSFQYQHLNVKLNGKWGVVDTTGRLLIPAMYDRIIHYYNAATPYADVKLNNKYGSVDSSGKEIIPVIYDQVKYLYNGVLISKDQKCGVVTKTGKELLPVKYEAIGGNSAHIGIFAIVPPTKAQINGKWLYIDSTGREVTEPVYDDIEYFWYGKLAAVKKGEKRAFIDNSGREVTAFTYDEIVPSEGFSHLFKCRTGDKWTILDENTAKEITPAAYDEIIFNNLEYDHGLFAVKQNGLWGFMDKTGKVIIKPQYVFDEIMPFKEGLAAVRNGERWGYINRAGKIVVPIEYEEVTGQYIDGKTGVKLDGKWGLVNKTGKIISPIESEYDIARGEDGC